jgi:hypothetical protein
MAWPSKGITCQNVFRYFGPTVPQKLVSLPFPSVHLIYDRVNELNHTHTTPLQRAEIKGTHITVERFLMLQS